MEHGGLAGPEQRARAVALGIPVTIQQSLLHDTAEVEEGFWGPERVARLFPARGWLDLGAQVSAGSDFPVGQFGAMRSVWGMITRQTVIGVKGPEHAITYDEALALHTRNAARLLGEEHLRGTLTPAASPTSPSGTRTPRTAPPTPCATSTPSRPSSAERWSRRPDRPARGPGGRSRRGLGFEGQGRRSGCEPRDAAGRLPGEMVNVLVFQAETGGPGKESARAVVT
nr:amidohydrolase family protein [Streptomyces sp. SID8354]